MNNSPCDIHGAVWPLGIPVALSWAEIGAILVLIHELGIKSFVELGVGTGGFAAILLARRDLGADLHYYGIEVDPAKMDERLRRKSEISYEDVFGENGVKWLERSIRDSYPPVLVFCDNGNKPKEATLVAGLENKPDYILMHDYPKEFSDADQPTGTTRIYHYWMTHTRLFLMKVEK